MTRRCRKRGRSAACRKWKVERKRRLARYRLARKCRSRRHRSSRACRKLRAQVRRQQRARRICGVGRGRARRRDTVHRMARRFRISPETFRRYNKLSKRTRRLRRGRWYVVYKSPFHNVRLAGGVELAPVAGVLKVQRPHRAWGRPLMVESLRTAAVAVQRAAALQPHLIFGDLSKKGGGCLPPHKSHRGGMDVDVGYYHLGGRQRAWLDHASPRDLDADRTWTFLSALLRPRLLQYAFIDYSLQPALYAAARRAGETPASLREVFQYPRPKSQSHSTIIRHLQGHADHMHLRFRCPTPSCTLTAADKQTMLQAAGVRRGGPDERRQRFGRRHARAARLSATRRTRPLRGHW